MNKIFKYSMVLLMTVVGFVACSDDDDNYQPGTVSGSQVFFSNKLPAQYEISTTATSFNVPISRGNALGAITVPLTVTQSEGSIFTVPTSVSFNDGQETANLTITYDPADIVYGKYDKITIAIADAAMATNYGLNTYEFTAGVTEWVKMSGTATYRDDAIGSLWSSVGNQAWAVNIYESALTPGRYMIEAPYSPKTDFRKSPLWDDEEEILKYWEDTGNCNMVIDATDPNYVYFEAFDMGMKDLADDGMMGFTSYVWYWLQNGNTLEEIKANRPSYFGKLEDGVISFPEPQTLVITLDGALSWYGNANGMTAIALPGYTFADYSAAVEYAGIFTDVANQTYVVANITLGEDATAAKAVVIEANADDDAVADAVAAGDLEATDVVAGTNQIAIPDGMSGNLKVVVVVLKGDEPKTTASAEFEYYGGGANPWESIGTGYLTDDFVWSYFLDENKQPKTIEVEIQVNNEQPGIYRMKQPYAIYADAWNEVYGKGDGKKDVDINAVDPEGVYILNQPLGFEFASYGMISIETRAGYWVSQNGFEAVKAERPELFGKLVNGEITFPAFEATDQESGNTYNYQGYINLPDGNGWNVGRNSAMKLVLPTASAAVKAQAKRSAKATSFERRMNAYNIKPAKQNKKAGVRGIKNKRSIKAKKAAYMQL